MRLIKVTKNGSLHFELADGRLGVTYESGYVRVSCKRHISMSGKLYQINKQTFTDPEDNVRGYTFVERELLPNQVDRINLLINFNNKNCK